MEKPCLNVGKHPVLLILVNPRVEPFNFCTCSLDLLLQFFLTILSLFLWNAHKVQISFNYPSNRIIHQGSFFCLGMFASSNRFKNKCCTSIYSIVQLSKISNIIFLSTQLTLLKAHFTFALGIPRNDFNCPFSFLYTNVMRCSNVCA